MNVARVKRSETHVAPEHRHSIRPLAIKTWVSPTLRLLAAGALIAVVSLPTVAKAGTFTTLYTFKGGADGKYPRGTLTYHGGALYGAVSAGGNGNVFKVDALTGRFKVVYAFKGGTDGSQPFSGVIYQGGVLYGTTSNGGGACDCGTIFSVNPKTEAEKVLYSFSQSSIGAAALVYVTDTLYGTTYYGGANGGGSVFSFNPTTGAYATLHDFSGGNDGLNPYPQLLYQNGLLYGTTLLGGGGGCPDGGCGTLFAIAPATGAETILNAFNRKKDGTYPDSNLFYHANRFYGATGLGGNSRDECKQGCGVSFTVKASTGGEKVFDTYDYTGASPSGLTLVGGNIYEVLPGPGGYGELAEVNLKTRQPTVLYTFSGGADGSDPVAPLIYHNGVFYGTTLLGGIYDGCGADQGCGTVFKYVP